MKEKSQTGTQQFNFRDLRVMGGYFLGGLGVVAISGWLITKYEVIAIDWSTLLPIGGIAATLIPFFQWLINFVQEKAKSADDRLDKLEALSNGAQESLERSLKERADLRRSVFKLEARIEAIKDRIDQLERNKK